MASDEELLALIRSHPELKSLLSRVQELERRVTSIERESHGPVAPREGQCPFCDGRLRLTEEYDHPTFGALGIKERVLTCEVCEKTVTRDYDSSKG